MEAAASASVVADKPQTIAGAKDPILRLGSVGFEVGKFVARKGQDESIKIHEIIALKDGYMTAKPVDPAAAEPIQITFDSVVQEWAIKKYKPPVKMHWMGNSALDSAAWELDALKAAVTLGLRNLCQTHEKRLQPNIQCIDSPKSVVYTGSSDIKQGELVLVPATKTVDIRGCSAAPPTGGLELGVFTMSSSGDKIRIHLMPMITWKPDNDLTENWVQPYWFVTRAAKPGNANMKIAKCDIQVSGINLSVPCMHNTKKVKTGDTLLMPPLPPTAKDVPAAPAPKRARR